MTKSRTDPFTMILKAKQQLKRAFIYSTTGWRRMRQERWRGWAADLVIISGGQTEADLLPMEDLVAWLLSGQMNAVAFSLVRG